MTDALIIVISGVLMLAALTGLEAHETQRERAERARYAHHRQQALEDARRAMTIIR